MGGWNSVLVEAALGDWALGDDARVPAGELSRVLAVGRFEVCPIDHVLAVQCGKNGA